MSEGFFHKIANYFTRNSVVSKVAGDPAIAAELLLLIKIIFADGERGHAETEVFAQIAQQQFDIPADALPDVIRYLGDYGYETTTAQAAALFSDLAPERRISLVRNLMAVASADNYIDENEVAFIERVSAILGISPQEVDEIWKSN
ncbi:MULTISPECIES: TerB family tellurite resistance protein [unclassified Bartonella]|uniref:tellurite resistance TerB family protein n=1 Tax=unclassified Bartonella TaxID=2645622 RepID=UPI0015FAECFA|nr:MULTISPECIES: TerB family tellurite resistance protein [unclassified Bartonella]UXM96245.1 TerB family tellurite resistance protein [Bartonella sp. HY329]UXN02308.1 TerB family tellurite resistance protein [Bartonella sp. HY406]UXN10569.1 TerB family tellurite resistance protein [Bartonella sp. HY328]